MGTDDLFDPQLFPVVETGDRRKIVVRARNFGNAYAICTRALDLLAKGKLPTPPELNLDGDRAYGWPTWELEHPPRPTPGPFYDHLTPASWGAAAPPVVVSAVVDPIDPSRPIRVEGT